MAYINVTVGTRNSPENDCKRKANKGMRIHWADEPYITKMDRNENVTDSRKGIILK